MTIEELDQEDLTLREVIHDLEKTILSYKVWIAKNDVARQRILSDMEAKSQALRVNVGDLLE